MKQITEQYHELKAILEKLESDEEEAKVITEKVKEFTEEKEAYAVYASFQSEDVDEIFLKYQKLSDLNEVSKKIKTQINLKKSELEELEGQLEPLKVFNGLNANVENEVLELNKEIENLKREQDKTDIQELDDHLCQNETRQKRITGLLVLILTLAVIPIGTYFYSKPMAMIASLILILAMVGVLIKRVKLSHQIKALLSEKKISFVSVSSINDEIGKKRACIEKILKLAHVESVEEFFRLKIIYDSKVLHFMEMNSEIGYLESELLLNNQKAASIKKEILEKLMLAGVMDDVLTEVSEEHIKEFKFGISRYKALEPGISYSTQRLNDLNCIISDRYRRAAAILDVKEPDRLYIHRAVENLISHVDKLNEKINSLHLEIERLLNEFGFLDTVIKTIEDQLMRSELSDIETKIQRVEDRIRQDLNECLLRITELETLLKNDDEEKDIQCVQEEILTLEERERQLQAMAKSLSIALDVLRVASLEIQQDYVPFINDKMSFYIGKMTGGRYHQLKADNGLMLKVIAPETGNVVNASLLSNGTMDQMYLALRLAMADLIEQNSERLPLIMDEVFAQYDDIRVKETINLFKELSEERQMILFTCKGWEIEIAKEICGNTVNVIELN